MKVKNFSKKDVKKAINNNGFFIAAELDFSKNAPAKYKNNIPEGAMYFEGIVSDGELNRNGYRIEAQALINAWPGFSKNPVILLMHDMEKPIGNALDAKPKGKGVWVAGYVYDELTENRFSKGLFKALSTGHLAEQKDVEFENQKTGERLSRDEFFELPYEERMSDEWNAVVVRLDWVEFSVVSIGSNRKALVTKKDVIEFYEKNGFISEEAINAIHAKNDGDTEEKEKEKPEEKEDDPEESEKTEPEPEKPDNGEEPEGNGDEGEEPAEPTDDGNKIKISLEEREKLENAAAMLAEALANTFAEKEKEEPEKAEPEQKSNIDALKETILNEPEKLLSAIQYLANKVDELKKENSRLQGILDDIPKLKAHAFNSGIQSDEPKKKKPVLFDALNALARNAVKM